MEPGPAVLLFRVSRSVGHDCVVHRLHQTRGTVPMDHIFFGQQRVPAIELGHSKTWSQSKCPNHDELNDFFLCLEKLRFGPRWIGNALGNGKPDWFNHPQSFYKATIITENKP